jgi:hypothetical protein
MGILDALRHENHLIDSLDDAIAHARSHAIPVVYPQAGPGIRLPMSTTQWVCMYLCVAALVAGAAVAFAARSRAAEQSMPHITVGPALLAGAVWPLLIVGVAQWLFVHALARTLRPQPERTSDVVYYGPPSASRRKVNAG